MGRDSHLTLFSPQCLINGRPRSTIETPEPNYKKIWNKIYIKKEISNIMQQIYIIQYLVDRYYAIHLCNLDWRVGCTTFTSMGYIWRTSFNSGRVFINIFLVFIRIRLISGGLEPVLIHANKLCLAPYYKQFITNIKMYDHTINIVYFMSAESK